MKVTENDIIKIPDMSKHDMHHLQPYKKIHKTVYFKCSECGMKKQLSKKEIIKRWGKVGWRDVLKMMEKSK